MRPLKSHLCPTHLPLCPKFLLSFWNVPPAKALFPLHPQGHCPRDLTQATDSLLAGFSASSSPIPSSTTDSGQTCFPKTALVTPLPSSATNLLITWNPNSIASRPQSSHSYLSIPAGSPHVPFITSSPGPESSLLMHSVAGSLLLYPSCSNPEHPQRPVCPQPGEQSLRIRAPAMT